MTAILIIREARRVHMVADGAAIGAGGEYITPIQKLFPAPHMGAVIGCAGQGGGIVLASSVAATMTSYDAMKAVALDDIQTTLAHADFPESHRSAHYELLIAGLSETRGPDSFRLTRERMSGLDAIACNSPHEPLLWEISQILAGKSIEAGALAAMQRMRQNLMPHPSGHTIAMAGAFVQLATVTPFEVTLRVIGRWPDKIGRLLNPEAEIQPVHGV